MLWPLILDATSTIQQLAPPELDLAGWAALLLGPYPLTIWLIRENIRKDGVIKDLTEAGQETMTKTFDALMRTMERK